MADKPVNEGIIFDDSLIDGPRLSEKTRLKIAAYIEKEFGIRMPPAKKSLLEARLAKRLRILSFTSYEQYADYLFSKEGAKNEVIHFINVISTNKTDFFREPNHFTYLTQTLLPEIINAQKIGTLRMLKVWSAACSSGEEPYTLAIVIEEFLESSGIKGYPYSIYASDISTNALDKGVKGIYEQERVKDIPEYILHKYFMKSKDPAKRVFRIVPEIRQKITFFRQNLIDSTYQSPHDFDIIFCRNALIYFEKATQAAIIGRLLTHMKANAHLFLGHSETIIGLDLDLQTVAPTIHRKRII